jgi:hypothetical protein
VKPFRMSVLLEVIDGTYLHEVVPVDLHAGAGTS